MIEMELKAEREWSSDDGQGLLDAPEEGTKYVLFREGPATLALSLEAVKRVYDVQGGSPPRTPGSRMIDLLELIGARAVITHNYWIELEIEGTRSLMPVENVEGIRELGLAVPVEFPNLLRRPETDYIKRLFFDGLRMICEVEGKALRGAFPGADQRLVGGTRSEERSAQELESAVGDDRKSGPAARLLIFQAGSQLWGLNLQEVIQVVIRGDVHYLPSSGPLIMGGLYYAEQAVPVVTPSTLGELLGGRTGPETAFGLVVLAETSRGLLGIGCDRIVEVAELESGTVPVQYRSVIPGRKLDSSWKKIEIDQLIDQIVRAVSAGTGTG